MKTSALSWLAIGLWLATAVAVGIMFVRGQTVPTDDARTPVVLDKSETAFILDEMQEMLRAIQAIVHGLANNDLKMARQMSAASGASRASAVPSSLMLKLPMGFKEQGRDIHATFDEIALAIDQGETRDVLLAHLDQLIARCVACHSAYQLR